MLDVLEKSEYAVDASQEIIDKIQHSESSGKLISEETVRDLKRVYINKHLYCKMKRLMDILLATIGVVLLAIPMALIAVAVYVDDPGTVIFSQYRIGRRGKQFKLYKFRTMRVGTPNYMSTMELHEPDRYITMIGRVLRGTSLDELPQLFNVIKGDMSLVGPRPLIANEYEMHTMRMRFGVYSVRPGITGLAQIHGRDLVSPAEKVHWDVKYLQDFGFWEDLKILVATIPKVLRRHGIVEGSEEMDMKV